MTPELTIAIVLHNSAGALRGSLDSIRAAVGRGWAEVVAVDNASPDDSVAVLAEWLPDAKVVRLAENRGFAAGANAALARATGRYRLLLNPDVRVPEGGLESLVAWMDRHPEVGVASPELVRVDGTWEAPGRAMPSAGRSLLELTRLHRLLPRDARGRVLRGPYWTGGDQLDAGWVPGAALLVRPAAVDRVGPLREDMFMYGEDIEWCWRMRRGGWRVGVCSTVSFIHDAGSSARTTWGSLETERRVAEGVDRACRIIYGKRHARLLAAVTALSMWAESAAPGRTSEHRRRFRSAAANWRAIAAGR
jgi:N-acetylglucosaminyl-diphospho-decaprenol L-rhamnosyltransferase